MVPATQSSDATQATDPAKSVPVTYLPLGQCVMARPGKTLLTVAHEAGIELVATCGGRGKCTSCRVKLLVGSFPPASSSDCVRLGEDDIRDGFRLACQTTITDRCEVQIAPLSSESAFQILASAGTKPLAEHLPLEPGIRKVTAHVELPTDENHQSSEVEAILAATALATERLELPLEILRRVPAVLDQGAGEVTLTVSRNQIIAIERGDTRRALLGLAIDVGTTTVVVELIDLNTGERVAVASQLNAQSVFGGDIMSRIAFTKKDPGGTRKLHHRLITLIEQLVGEVCQQSGAVPEQIYRAVVVGNTCMHHLFLGIDPSHVGFSPYSPIVRKTVSVKSRDLGFKWSSMADVILLPNIGGFVGADAMAVILATGLDRGHRLQMAVDIGTNGEVLLGSAGRLMACSAPAGPALEGAQIQHGMRASLGAIDKVHINDDVAIHVIGDVRPSGICGSGMIDALATCLDAGILNKGGLLLTDRAETFPLPIRPRLRTGNKYREFVLAWAHETSNGKDIVLTQDDIRQLQLAKGAIASGIRLLQLAMGVQLQEIETFYLSGGFGNYLDLRNAQRIGLIPPLPQDRIAYVGNAALLGARRALLSEAELARAEQVAREIEHVAIGIRPDFQEVFLETVAFP